MKNWTYLTPLLNKSWMMKACTSLIKPRLQDPISTGIKNGEGMVQLNK
jgi:hypothetical protein